MPGSRFINSIKCAGCIHWSRIFTDPYEGVCLASCWFVVMFWINPAVLPWFVPFCTALILSVPLSVYLSRSSLGQAAKRLCLFQSPEESCLPPIVAATRSICRRRRNHEFPGGGFIHAVADPWANRLHVQLLRGRAAKSARSHEFNKTLRDLAMRKGLDALSSSQKASLLRDAEGLRILHTDIYRRGADRFANHRTCEDFYKSPRITPVNPNHPGEEPRE